LVPSWFLETREIHHPDFQTAILKLENALASSFLKTLLIYKKNICIILYNLKLVNDLSINDYKILNIFHYNIMIIKRETINRKRERLNEIF